MTLKWAEEERIPLLAALASVTTAPAAILGVALGTLAVGAAADVCVFDAEEPWQLTSTALRSRGKNTPFLGYEMKGRVRATVVGGRVVYTAA